MPQRLTDVREISITVPNGDSDGNTVFLHGLEDNAGNDLEPDVIIVELLDTDDYDSPTLWQVGTSRPDVDYTNVWVRTNVNGGADWTLNFRVTSIYLHSIQSDDHTV